MLPRKPNLRSIADYYALLLYPIPLSLRRFARQFKFDFGNIPTDLLDFILSTGRLHIADNRLYGENARAQQVDCCLRAESFPVFEHLERRLND